MQVHWAWLRRFRGKADINQPTPWLIPSKMTRFGHAGDSDIGIYGISANGFGLVGLDVGRPDHLGPLVGLIDD